MPILLSDQKIRETVQRMSRNNFTVLDFTDQLQSLYPDEWNALTRRFGEFGEKRRYTVTTYLSNRLDVYSHKADSTLKPFVRYSQARFRSYRRTNQEEKKRFGSPWIAVFEKRKRGTLKCLVRE